MRFRDDGCDQTLLIEWKYTESYGPPIAPAGNPTRITRHTNLAFAPEGPIRSDFGLCFQTSFMSRLSARAAAEVGLPTAATKEDGSDRFRVFISRLPGTSPLGRLPRRTCGHRQRSFVVFRSLLVRPDDFVSRSTETLFAPLLVSSKGGDDWATYLARRYAFLADAAPPA